MPPKKAAVRLTKNSKTHNPYGAARREDTENLLATEAERHATSKTMYGDSCARIGTNVHSLHDPLRTAAYTEGLLKHGVRGKRVLHLGCDFGLYTLLAAKAGGAAFVVGVDTTAALDATRVVAEQNHLSDSVLLLRGRLRDVLGQLPTHSGTSSSSGGSGAGSGPVRREDIMKFDVVLCEWMGTFLLNEYLLDDARYARDYLLAPGTGVLCPDTATLYACGVSDYHFRLETEDYWSNVYGYRMTAMKALVNTEVEMCAIPRQCLATAASAVHTVRLAALPPLTGAELEAYEEAAATAEAYRVKKTENPVEARWAPSALAQEGFTADFSLTAAAPATINFMTFYVDASFTHPTIPEASFALPISPGGPNPWTEVSVHLPVPLPVAAGEAVTGTLRAAMPASAGGKATRVELTARSEGRVAALESVGEYYYQS